MSWRVYEVPYNMSASKLNKSISSHEVYSDVLGLLFEGYIFIKDGSVSFKSIEQQGFKFIGFIQDNALPTRIKSGFTGLATFYFERQSAPVVVLKNIDNENALIWWSGFFGGLEVVNYSTLSQNASLHVQDSVLFIDIEKIYCGIDTLDIILDTINDYNPTSCFVLLPKIPIEHSDYLLICKLLYYCGFILSYSKDNMSDQIFMLTDIYKAFDCIILAGGKNIFGKDKIFLDKGAQTPYIITKELNISDISKNQGYVSIFPDSDMVLSILKELNILHFYSRLHRFFQ